MSHDIEDSCKIWRETDFLFQKWREFDEFWSKLSKILEIYCLIGSFRKKYVVFGLKFRGAIFHDTREWCKTWRKTDLWFGKELEEVGKFSSDYLKVGTQNWDFYGVPLSQVENVWS